MSEQIPPVPPNWILQLATSEKATPCFKDADTEACGVTWLESDCPTERKIIACVAAQYWRMEAGRANTMDEHIKHFNGDMTPAESAEYLRRSEANQHAAAWLAWGGLDK